MIIAKSPILVNGKDRRQVIMEYDNTRYHPYRIVTNSLFVESKTKKVFTSSGNGIYTPDERKAQHLFVEKWVLLKDCGFEIDVITCEEFDQGNNSC